jgi:hypothetical protein
MAGDSVDERGDRAHVDEVIEKIDSGCWLVWAAITDSADKCAAVCTSREAAEAAARLLSGRCAG